MSCYEEVLKFKKRFKRTICFRLRANSDVVERHLNDDEEIQYAFAGQKNDSFFDIFSTCVVVLTNKRILIGQKRVLFGYSLNSITPDLFNDMQIFEGLLWGKVTIDTVKETVIITNLDKSSLVEIESIISSFMMEEKKKYMNYSE